MKELTISTGPFSIAIFDITRGFFHESSWLMEKNHHGGMDNWNTLRQEKAMGNCPCTSRMYLWNKSVIFQFPSWGYSELFPLSHFNPFYIIIPSLYFNKSPIFIDEIPFKNHHSEVATKKTLKPWWIPSVLWCAALPGSCLLSRLKKPWPRSRRSTKNRLELYICKS